MNKEDQKQERKQQHNEKTQRLDVMNKLLERLLSASEKIIGDFSRVTNGYCVIMLGYYFPTISL
jgi:hypothetical protein